MELKSAENAVNFPSFFNTGTLEQQQPSLYFKLEDQVLKNYTNALPQKNIRFSKLNLSFLHYFLKPLGYVTMNHLRVKLTIGKRTITIYSKNSCIYSKSDLYNIKFHKITDIYIKRKTQQTHIQNTLTHTNLKAYSQHQTHAYKNNCTFKLQ